MNFEERLCQLALLAAASVDNIKFPEKQDSDVLWYLILRRKGDGPQAWPRLAMLGAGRAALVVACESGSVSRRHALQSSFMAVQQRMLETWVDAEILPPVAWMGGTHGDEG